MQKNIIASSLVMITVIGSLAMTLPAYSNSPKLNNNLTAQTLTSNPMHQSSNHWRGALGKLSLSNSQQERMKALLEKNKALSRQLTVKVNNNDKLISSLVMSDKYNKKRLSSMIKKQGRLWSKWMLKQGQFKQKIYQLLNTGQKQKIRTMLFADDGKVLNLKKKSKRGKTKVNNRYSV